ncbi:MAG: UvrB/UvrC motif-containing protein, partial [Patescibacteria group bacterium]
IKKYKPKYNIILKDDKSYIYIVVRNEKVSISGKFISLPKVITARKTEIQDKDIFFGPYPNSSVTKNILGTIRKVFQYRDCSSSKFSRYEKLQSPCLFGHINLCSMPCVLKSSEDIKKYKGSIKNIKKILSGEAVKMISGIKKEMKRYSKSMEYEKAALYRNLLSKFSYIQNTFRDATEYIDNPYLVQDTTNKSMEEIIGIVPLLNNKPKRIECYDISNLSGKEAVGSMVVATNGKIDKKEYRRFKIKFKDTPDDYGMMYEVLSRRLSRESKNKKISKSNKLQSWGVPDLIVVDGGRPQVSAAYQVMQDLQINIPLVGIAKKYETLVSKQGDDFDERRVDKSNLGMRLLITLRDESHRFAQRYHHLLRQKSLRV